METLEKAMEIAGFNVEEKKQLLRRKLEQLESVEADISIEVESAELRSGKKRKKEVSNWLNNVARVREEVQSIEREADRRWSILLQKCIHNKIEEVQQLVERVLPGFQSEYLEHNGVNEVAARKHCTPSQLSLARFITDDEMMYPIPRPTKIENLDQHIEAFSVKLIQKTWLMRFNPLLQQIV